MAESKIGIVKRFTPKRTGWTILPLSGPGISQQLGLEAENEADELFVAKRNPAVAVRVELAKRGSQGM